MALENSNENCIGEWYLKNSCYSIAFESYIREIALEGSIGEWHLRVA